MYDDVIMNHYGFYSLKVLPSNEERIAYYRDRYYNDDSQGFATHYSDHEMRFFEAKLEQKLLLIKAHLPTPLSLIDIGCGEGFAVSFFKRRGFAVLGLDYSDAGIKNHNIDILDSVIIGDVFDSLNDLITLEKQFDVVNMDCVLEHITDPAKLLKLVNRLMRKGSIAIIKVPNDFSVLQQYFINNGIFSKPHWVAPLDHISYFNSEGLINICAAYGFRNLEILGNYMTEFFALNPNTNYFENPEVGKSCHLARVALENLLHSISPEKTLALYRTLGEMGLGREIIGVFTKEGS